MVKTTNNVLKGHVRSRYGASMVPGLKVWAVPTAMNIQGTAMRVDTTRNNGLYILDSLREGPYTVTVTAGDSAYVFLRTLKTTPSPASSGITSVSADNSSPTTGVRDLQGVGDTKSTDFEAYRSDTKFSGIIVNDRDTDLTTIDPGEALAGAVINLFRDDDGSATPNVADTLIGTATTDANGAYSFTGLVEGRYTAVWGSGTPDNSVQVMTKLSTAGAATTQISATPLMALNVKQTGNLPAWNYANPGSPSNLAPANFTFLYANTVVQGTVLKQGTATPVPGMSITLQKCYLSTANAGGSALTNVSGPRPDDGAATTCTSFFAGSNTVVTDAAGNFQFANLREGVYRVTPAPGTVPPYASFVGVATGFAASPGVDDGRSGLFLTVGSGDIESLQFDVY
jgi:protocatechuate 3,4-dioxygenase beta subunit